MENKEKDKKINISCNNEPLFIDINPDNPVNEIESLCMNCQKNGITRLLMTKIPFFKDIIIMSFACPHCGFKNNEIEQAEGLAPQGIHFVLDVVSSNDMNRKVIKSNNATINVPCCKLEIPTTTQKGKLSTVEGFISTALENFKTSYEDGYYNEMGDEFINNIKEMIKNLEDVINGKKFPFEFILDDPSGNSFIENPHAPQTDQNIKVTYFNRTKEMTEAMGYSLDNQIEENKDKINEDSLNNLKNNVQQVQPNYYDKTKSFTVYKSNSEISNRLIDFTKGLDDLNVGDGREKSIEIKADCFCCGQKGVLRTCFCTIPYFKELLINCFKCEVCGYKTTEVKGGGGMSEKGLKITLNVESQEDLNRDVFKSETSKIIIPEAGFESSDGSMGSMYTTVEGIIEKLCESLLDTPFTSGDSAGANEIRDYVSKLKQLQELKQKFTLIIDDPLSNSFIFPIGEPEKDKRLIKEEYERTFEQNEELGINDMKTEDY